MVTSVIPTVAIGKVVLQLTKAKYFENFLSSVIYTLQKHFIPIRPTPVIPLGPTGGTSPKKVK